MAETFTTNLGLEQIGTGDLNNAWGPVESTNKAIIDNAVGGVVSQSVAGSSNYSLTFTQGNSSQNLPNRKIILTGALTGSIDVFLPNGRGGNYIFENSTSGAFTVTLANNNGSGAPAGRTVVIPQGQTIEIFSDGTNVDPAENATGGALTVNGNLVATGSASAAGITSTGLATLSGAALNETSATVASAATTNIGAAAANYLFISGTTTITAFDTVQSGTRRTLEFQGSLVLTNNANIILPGGANITTAAGDVAIFHSEGSGVWRCATYTKASGVFGNVTGPASSTANDIPKFADTTGKALADGYTVGTAANNIPQLTASAALPAAITPQLHQQVFTASGTFTTPAGTGPATVFKFTVVGGGGGGHDVNATNTAAGGGGAGGTAVFWGSGVAAGTNVTVTVGSGGANNANGNASSIVFNGTTVTANGGSAGTFIGANSSGGPGGTATNGTINITGGDGGPGFSGTWSGYGGASSLSGNARGVDATNGVAGSAPGAGGSGASNSSSATGGAGAAGIVIVEWVQ